MTTTTHATHATRRTGGRSAIVLAAVRSAVEELLEERGSERITIPLVAERAGINPTSIYRRWGDLPTLISEVASYRLDPDRPLPDTGDLRQDLLEWANELATHFGKPVNASLLRAGAALAGEDSDCTYKRRNEAVILVERAQARGCSGPNADDVINHIVAPITYRVIFAPLTLNEGTISDLVDVVFRASSPAPRANAATGSDAPADAPAADADVSAATPVADVAGARADASAAASGTASQDAPAPAHHGADSGDDSLPE